MIKGLIPRLAERGKIKCGGLSQKTRKARSGREYHIPEKYDHFVITKLDRDPKGNFKKDEELMRKYSLDGGPITELPIRLLYDNIDLNFLTRYACYVGRKCWCSGDGEKASRLDDKGQRHIVKCPCERTLPEYPAADVCKMNGVLSVVLDDVPRVGGVWKFRTTSFNSVQNILSSLAVIKATTGGVLAWIPLRMVLSPKSAIIPEGQQTVVYVVSIEYAGTMGQLRSEGYATIKSRIEHQVRMDLIEEEARKAVVLLEEETAEEQEDVQKEYYPDAVEVTPTEDKPLDKKLTEAAEARQKEINRFFPKETSDGEEIVDSEAKSGADFKLF